MSRLIFTVRITHKLPDMYFSISGIGTSSFGCDKRLRESAFPFECVRASNRVIVVKSHAFRLNSIHSFERAILLIRNPYANLVAYFNYRYGGGHTGYAKAKSYKSECLFTYSGGGGATQMTC